MKICYIPPKKISSTTEFYNKLNPQSKKIFDDTVNQLDELGIPKKKFNEELKKIIKKVNFKNVPTAALILTSNKQIRLLGLKNFIWEQGISIVELGQTFAIVMILVLCLWNVCASLKDGDPEKIWKEAIKFVIAAITIIFLPQIFMELASGSGIYIPNEYVEKFNLQNNEIEVFSQPKQPILIPEGSTPPAGYSIAYPNQ